MTSRGIVVPILACVLALLAVSATRPDGREPPRIRIVVSAAIHGEVEPCG